MGQRLELEGGGWLEVREQGGYVQLSACRKREQDGLYKVRLLGAGGTYLLGTMIPEGDQLCLRRTLSRDALTMHGVWPVTGGIVEMAYSFTDIDKSQSERSWRWEHHPALLFQDGVLSEAAAAWGSMLFRAQPDGFQLAAAYDHRHPFPLTPVFCFGCICTVDNQPHISFLFSKNGTPKIP